MTDTIDRFERARREVIAHYDQKAKEKEREELLEKLSQSYKSLPVGSGWICPKCGCVYGPAATECTRCNPPIEYKVTC